MAKKTATVPCLTSIGETAGAIWRALSKNGPMTMTKLIKDLGEQRDQVMLGLGWLARENKIDIVEDKRSRVVSLT
ncbi:MAG: winged helix-turn-helix domain-containing protein [Pirellulaceae bacterium]|nr:winged helix-turn-helix domain-containing protein [Pirellulaceae bacterium]